MGREDVIVYLTQLITKSSFTGVAKKHAKYLSYIKPVFLEDITKYYLAPLKDNVVVYHPIGYNAIGEFPQTWGYLLSNLGYIYSFAKDLVGFDVADTDHISEPFVECINEFFSHVFLPTNYSRWVYRKSGVKAKLHVIPHGIDTDWCNIKVEWHKLADQLKDLILLKQKGYNLILYFMWHSPIRKGLDITINAMCKVQKENPKALLVVKTSWYPVWIILRHHGIKHYCVNAWLDDYNLSALYKICDVLIVPSRSGGFELNALEGVAYGTPTIAHGKGCFSDYKQYLITCKAKKGCKVLPHKALHDGYGFDIDPSDLADKILTVLHDLDYYKQLYKLYAKEVQVKYNWDVIGNRLIKMWKKYIG